MKNIKKVIKESYHEKELSQLKETLDIDNESSAYVKKKTPLFISSIVSFTAAFVLMVVVLVVTLPKGTSLGPNDTTVTVDNDSFTSSYLENNTNKHLKDPIKIIYDDSSNTLVKIYYGINNNVDGYNHYFLIEHQLENDLTYQVDVYAYSNDQVENDNFVIDSINEEYLIEYNNSTTNEHLVVKDYQTILENIVINIKIKDRSYILIIDLEKYYYDLVYLSFS